MDYDIDIYIKNKKRRVVLENNYILGKGCYGTVYYHCFSDIGKCAIKLSHVNKFDYENYIYYKYHKANEMNCCLPKCHSSGSSKNKIDDKYYYYIILEYCGYFNLKSYMDIISNNVSSCDLLMITKILYLAGLKCLDSLHKHNIICRDLKLENIVISDNILAFIISKIDKNIVSFIPKHIMDLIIDTDVNLNNIFQDLKNNNLNNIMKFIDKTQ